MKKRLLAVLPITVLFCSCSLSNFHIGNWRPFDKGEDGPSEGQNIDDVIPEDTSKHSTSVSASHSAPFYLKVSETVDLSVSLSPAPEKEEEKQFSWKVTGSSISYEMNPTDTKKVTVKGIAVGTSTITATNTYNANLNRTFTIKVIDFDENDYVWQYNQKNGDSDKKAFGWTSGSEGVKKGTASGTATLAGMDWTYTRDENQYGTISSGYGSLKFGTADPYEHYLDLEADNSKTVTKIAIEVGAAHGLAEVSVQVGETTFISGEHPDTSGDSVKLLSSSDSVDPSTGKIKIHIENSAPTSNPEEPQPGAIYLKSIYIFYEVKPIIGFQITSESLHKTSYVENKPIVFDGLALQKETEDHELINLNVEAEILLRRLTANLSSSGEASASPKEVILSYTPKGYSEPFTCSYDINVETGFTLSKVTKLSDIDTTSNYFIISEKESILLKGSLSPSNILSTGKVEYDPTLDLENSISLVTSLRNDFVMFEESSEEGKMYMKSQSGGYFGLKADGSAQCTSTAGSPVNKDLTLVANGNATFTISCDYTKDEAIKTKYFGADGGKKFGFYASSKEVVIYKA